MGGAKLAAMAHRNPRTLLATHEVSNQPPPLEDVNLYSADAILTSCAKWSGADAETTRLTKFGARVGGAEAQSWGAQANRTPPIFQPKRLRSPAAMSRNTGLGIASRFIKAIFSHRSARRNSI